MPSHVVRKEKRVCRRESFRDEPSSSKTRTSTASGIAQPSAIDAQGVIMLAHSAVCAEESRADLADGEVLPAKPNSCPTPDPSGFRWKWAYRQCLSLKSFKSSLRGLMQVLVDNSDPMGRIWWGQTELAQRAKCTTRTIRRYIALLEAAGLLRKERQTFKSLTAAQGALGLPVPYRNDEGRAPDLLTLLVDGEPAYSYSYSKRRTVRAQEVPQDKPIRDKPRPDIARTLPEVKNVQGEPRTRAPEIPPDKMTDDLIRSAYLTRKVEGDLGGPGPISVVETAEREMVAPQNSLTAPMSAPVDLDAWRTLNTAYEAHYRRVYHATPTQKRVSTEEVQAMTTHLVELAGHFEKRLSEHGVALESLEKPPLHMLAEEALRSWFDSPGANNFLRRVSHRMRELAADLPYRVRRALDTLMHKLVPKQEPRRASESTDVGRRVVHDKPPPIKLPMPAFRSMGSMMQRPSLRAGHEPLSVHAREPGFGATVPRADAREGGGTT
jgi:HTH domain